VLESTAISGDVKLAESAVRNMTDAGVSVTVGATAMLVRAYGIQAARLVAGKSYSKPHPSGIEPMPLGAGSAHAGASNTL